MVWYGRAYPVARRIGRRGVARSESAQIFQGTAAAAAPSPSPPVTTSRTARLTQLRATYETERASATTTTPVCQRRGQRPGHRRSNKTQTAGTARTSTCFSSPPTSLHVTCSDTDKGSTSARALPPAPLPDSASKFSGTGVSLGRLLCRRCGDRDLDRDRELSLSELPPCRFRCSDDFRCTAATQQQNSTPCEL